MKRLSHIRIAMPRWGLLPLRRLLVLISGGSWSHQLPSTTRTSLRWFLLDGLFANASGTIITTYQSIYLLALGATRGEIGLLGAITNLMMPLAMFPGALLARRGKGFKPLVIIVSLVGRLALLGFIFLPYFSSQVRLIVLGIGFVALYNFFMNLLNPAWTALVGQIVPAQWRGRYFSARNILMGSAAFFIVLGMGRLVDAFDKPLGYQVAFGIAVVAGLGATAAFSRVEEPPQAARAGHGAGLLDFLGKLRGRGRFLTFCGIAALWNFGVQVASAFFIVYLVEVTHASATAIGFTSAVASLAALPGQRVFGILSDRKGSRWVQQVTGFIIPLVPAVWGFMNQTWHAFPVQAISGFIWAGYNLAAFNLLLDMTPEEGRPPFVAFYQTVVGLGMVGGAALGGWVAQTQGYRPVFLLSAALRLVGAALFALMVVQAKSFPKVRLPVLRLPKVRRPKISLPKRSLPKVTLPKITLPKIKWPRRRK